MGGDPAEQAAVLACHPKHARGTAPVEQRHELDPAFEPDEASLGAESDHELDRTCERATLERAPEALEVLAGQVDAAVRSVLADVAKRVSDLEGDAEIVGETGAGPAVGALEDAERQTSDRTGDT